MRKQKVVSLALTPVEYNGLQAAYDHFNAELFGGQLPDLLITLQRRANSKGYYSANRFSSRGSAARHDELALNPDTFISRTDQEIASTLVHEQVHVWQHHFGKEPSRSYHDKQWAAKMKSIGLQPSSTGAVGGKETGARVTHYIIPGGLFEKSFARLAAKKWKLNLQSAHRPGPQVAIPNSKTKFSCQACHQNAWGKPDLQIICGSCAKEFIEGLTKAKDIAIAKRLLAHIMCAECDAAQAA